MEFILKSTVKTNRFFENKKEIYQNMSNDFFEVCIRFISEAISHIGEYHPNYKYLLIKLMKHDSFKIDLNSINDLGNDDILKQRVQKLSYQERDEIIEFVNIIKDISISKKLELDEFLCE